MPISKTPSTEDLYAKFLKALANNRPGEWVLAVFEGSPSEGVYSWCSDCVAASRDLSSFLREYTGDVKVSQFKVGTKDEWEDNVVSPSPFRVKFPFLSDLPTAILFNGKLDVARFIAPRKEDLQYLSNRATIYENQEASGSWNPPKEPGVPSTNRRLLKERWH
jgi:Eukaryotic protein of unknown function (DUF953)